MNKKLQRIDVLLVNKGLADSRQKAQAFVIAGEVFANGQKVHKASQRFPSDTQLEVKLKHPRFVSRGGEKLAAALDNFQLTLTDYLCLDVGVSTGGFTDCLLQRGVQHVFGVDTGYGQVAWQIRQDPRVTLFEKTNIRYFDVSLLQGARIDLVVIDVSFISLKLVFPKVFQIVKPAGEVIALVKPQFEVGKERVGKGGIVRNEQYKMQVLEEIKNFAIKKQQCSCLGSFASPIRGAKGNEEFFLYLKAPEGNHV